MRLQQLNYFITVAEYGSIHKAAQILYTSQQNVSRAIKHLEEELQVPLFKRTNNGVTVTPKGRIIYTQAKHIQFYNDQLLSTARTLSNHNLPSISGDLYLHAVSGFMTLITTTMKRLAPLYPKINIHSAFFEPNDLNFHLPQTPPKDHIFFTYFHQIPNELSLQYEIITLPQENIVLSCSETSPLKHYNSISLQTLSTIPLFIYQSSPDITPLIIETLQNSGLTFNNLIYLDDSTICSSFLADGNYASLSFQSGVSTPLNYDLPIYDIPLEKQFSFTPCILIPKTEHISSAASLFIQTLRNTI